MGTATLSAVVPAYNEEATIVTMLESLVAVELVEQVIVVDDCSRDGTATAVESVSSPKVELVRHEKNRGKTAAVRTGLERVRCDLVIIQDADLEYDPQEIPLVVEPILAGRADVVYGSRFLVRKAARVLYFHHYAANKLLTFLSNVFTNHNMTDIETCYKAFRTPLLKDMKLTSSGFGMEVEITAMVTRTGARIYEVPVSYYGRTYEEGKKIGWKDGLMAIWYVFHYNLIARWHRDRREYFRKCRAWLAEQRSGAPG